MTILERLRKDPSLRFTESGRTLLQLLAACTVGADQLPEVFAMVPPHCAAMVVEFVRAVADGWVSLADELEDRAVVSAEG
jgi:hypothetical protein